MELFRVSHKDQNMSSYIDRYMALFNQLAGMGKHPTITESRKAPMQLVFHHIFANLKPVRRKQIRKIRNMLAENEHQCDS